MFETLGREVKWISIGGSYAGALSAWFRTIFPDKVFAAWSSSGVVQPIEYFDAFDREIKEATSLSPGCSDRI